VIFYSAEVESYHHCDLLQVEDKEEMKEILEMKRVHQRTVKRRKEGCSKILSSSPSPDRVML
jgi:hypothetical protein